MAQDRKGADLKVGQRVQGEGWIEQGCYGDFTGRVETVFANGNVMVTPSWRGGRAFLVAAREANHQPFAQWVEVLA